MRLSARRELPPLAAPRQANRSLVSSNRQTEHGVHTVLMGQLPDQAALLGVPGRLTVWGYVILQVRYNSAAELLHGE